jgi:hypothetical protein
MVVKHQCFFISLAAHLGRLVGFHFKSWSNMVCMVVVGNVQSCSIHAIFLSLNWARKAVILTDCMLIINAPHDRPACMTVLYT